MQSVRNKKKKKLFQDFSHLHLGIGWYDLLQIWYADLPSLGTSQQEIWLNSGKRSESYVDVKITFLASCQYTHGVARQLLGRTTCLDNLDK